MRILLWQAAYAVVVTVIICLLLLLPAPAHAKDKYEWTEEWTDNIFVIEMVIIQGSSTSIYCIDGYKFAVKSRAMAQIKDKNNNGIQCNQADGDRYETKMLRMYEKRNKEIALYESRKRLKQ